jgi:hypothetical protein
MNDVAVIIANALIFSNLDCWRPPAYYLEKKNAIKLLEITIDETATINDVDMFLCVPVRHEYLVEGIPLHCKKFMSLIALFTYIDFLQIKGLWK